MAFDPGFVGYTPDPSGGKYFHRPDGSQLFFYGPEADQMATLIDQSRPPDARIASADPGFSPIAPTVNIPAQPMQFGAPPAPPMPSDRDVQASLAPVGPPEAGQYAAKPDPAAPTVNQPQVAPTSDAALPMLPTPAEPGAPQMMLPDLTPRGGGGPARMVPKTQTVTTEGALPRDPAMLDAYQSLDKQAVETAAKGYEAQRAQYQAQELAAQAAEPVLAHQAAQARADMARKRRDLELQTMEADRLMGEATDQKLDPDHYMASKGTFGRIMTILGVAMANAAGALHGNANAGFAALNQFVQQDIEKQKAEIARKGMRANNMLSRILPRFQGDVDLASQALAMAQQAKIDNQARIVASQLGTQQAMQNYQQFVQARQEQALKRFQDFQDAAAGKITSTQTFAMQAPGGGYDPLRALKRQAEGAAALASIKKSEREFSGGADPKDVQEFSRALVQSNTGPAREAIADYAKSYALTQDKTGQWKSSRPDGDVPGTGMILPHLPSVTPEGRERDRTREQMITNIGIALSGAKVDEKERDSIVQSMTNARSPEELMNAVNRAQRTIDSKARDLEAGYGKSVVDTFNRNKRDTARKPAYSKGTY